MPAQNNAGTWFNKRAISFIEIPVQHVFRPTPEGWEVEVGAPGTFVVRLVHGGEQRFTVGAGDTLRASGEEMYLRFTQAGAAASSQQKGR